ncbi:MAG: phosphoribosylaminoimidazolesuccinocarboxamide synthase [Saezia sp.]
MNNPAIYEPKITSLPLLAKGKVRNNYQVDEQHILMVASDRLSAFDVVMNQPIPQKGVLLTQMALFWFDLLKDIIPNHLTGIAPESVVTPEEISQVQGRSMVVKRLRPILVEAVVRGYITGSGWKEYQQTQTICGLSLPAGLHHAEQLPEPVFTPAGKAAIGEHDENISFSEMSNRIGVGLAKQIRDTSIQLYQHAYAYALEKGIIIADTKFEFGLDDHDQLVLMDEILTPDSSRYWPLAAYHQAYEQGSIPPSYDKQFVRDWLETATVNGSIWNKRPPAPDLPEDIIQKTRDKYSEAFQHLCS